MIAYGYAIQSQDRRNERPRDEYQILGWLKPPIQIFASAITRNSFSCSIRGRSGFSCDIHLQPSLSSKPDRYFSRYRAGLGY